MLARMRFHGGILNVDERLTTQAQRARNERAHTERLAADELEKQEVRPCLHPEQHVLAWKPRKDPLTIPE